MQLPNTENSTIADAEECVTEHIAIDKNIIRSKNEITSKILTLLKKQIEIH
jgi:hypothetical protein